METVEYTRREAARALGISADAFDRAEKKVAKDLYGDKNAQPERYDSESLDQVRGALGLFPDPPAKQRCQLFLNFKGGTGKTSLSTSYAYRLSELGYRVLVLDLDSQGHATKCLGFEGSEFDYTLADVLIHRRPITDCIHPAGVPRLDFVPSNLTMATVELSLMPLAAREFRLRNGLKGLETTYDFVIMDAPPNFGLLNLNALMASQDLIVPVLTDFLSFDGLGKLFETVHSLEEDLEHCLEQVFVVANGFNASFRIAREALSALEDHYAEYLLDTVIRQCTKFAQASSEGRPIFVFDSESKGARDIDHMVREIFERTSKLTTAKLKTAKLAAERPQR